jgi:hypothetical protein
LPHQPDADKSRWSRTERNDRPPALGTLEGTYQSNCSMPGSGTPWSFRLVGSVMRAAGVVGLVLLVALVVGVVFASNFSLNA